MEGVLVAGEVEPVEEPLGGRSSVRQQHRLIVCGQIELRRCDVARINGDSSSPRRVRNEAGVPCFL